MIFPDHPKDAQWYYDTSTLQWNLFRFSVRTNPPDLLQLYSKELNPGNQQKGWFLPHGRRDKHTQQHRRLETYFAAWVYCDEGKEKTSPGTNVQSQVDPSSMREKIGAILVIWELQKTQCVCRIDRNWARKKGDNYLKLDGVGPVDKRPSSD